MKPCRLKDYKFTSLQSSPRPEIDPRPPSSLAILSESDQAILIIFDHKLWKPVTLLWIIIEILSVCHLNDMIHICLEPDDQGPRKTFMVPHFNLKWPHFTI